MTPGFPRSGLSVLRVRKPLVIIFCFYFTRPSLCIAPFDSLTNALTRGLKKPLTSAATRYQCHVASTSIQEEGAAVIAARVRKYPAYTTFES